MKIIYRDNTLRHFAANITSQEEGGVFKYQGHLYCIVQKLRSEHASIYSDKDYIACMDLRWRAIHGIKKDAIIQPVKVEIHVNS